MGNELFSNYTIEKTPFVQGGYMKLWKIYHGKHKVRKQEVCVFVFDKKVLEKYPKNEHEEILMTLKCEAHSLVKFKHPSLLGVIEPFVEDKTTLGFVTQRFDYTLNSWMALVKPTKLEIKQMIIELSKVILFLHNDAHVIHGNINPDIIFIDLNNRVKLSGLSFSMNDPPLQGSDINLSNYVPTVMSEEINPHHSHLSLPVLSYVAPEMVYSNKLYYSSDIFSFGLIIYQLLKDHLGDKNNLFIKISSNSINNYKSFCTSYESYIVSKIKFENDDNNLLTRLLQKDQGQRPRMREILDSPWFNDPKLKALNFIMNLESNDQKKNVEFLEKFPRIVGMFENKIIIKRFLPSLLNAIKTEALINPCLPAIFSICESPNFKINFTNEIWPRIKELLKLKTLPAAAIYFLISKVQYIGEHIPNNEFNKYFLNLICKAMDCNVQKIQFVVSNNMKYIAKSVDSMSFKNDIYPRMLQVISTTNSKNLKLDMLNNLKALYTKLDQNIINNNLLSSLEKVREKDNNNEICMCICDIYLEIAKIVNLENIGNKILPNLIGMLVSGNITKGNFDMIMNLVTTYLDQIKKNRYSELVDDGQRKGINLAEPSLMGNTPSLPVAKNDEDNFMDTLLASSAPITTTNTNNKGTGDFLNNFFDKNSNNLTNNNNPPPTTNNVNKTNSNKNNNNFGGFGNNNLMTNNNNASNDNNNSSAFDFNFVDSSKNNPAKKNNDIFSGVSTTTNYNTPITSSNNNNNMDFMNNTNKNNNNTLFNNLTVNSNNNNKDDLLNNLMNDLPKNNNNNNNFNNNNNNFNKNNNNFNSSNNNFNNNFMNLNNNNNNSASNNPFDELMGNNNSNNQNNQGPTGVGNTINFDFNLSSNKPNNNMSTGGFMNNNVSNTNTNNNNPFGGLDFGFSQNNNTNNNNNNSNDIFSAFGNTGNNNNNNKNDDIFKFY